MKGVDEPGEVQTDLIDKAIARRTAEAQALKAEADARNAKIAASQAAAEAREWNSSAAQRARAAGHDKAVADARSAATETQAKVIDSLVPALSGVDRGTTSAGGTPLFTTLLTQRSMTSATQALAGEVADKLVKGKPVLLVTDQELASSDAAYLSVTNGLEQILTLIDKAIGKKPTKGKYEPMGGASMAAAAAAVLPPVLSLLTSNRSLTGAETSVDPALTVASVTRELQNLSIDVVLDDFRLLDAQSRVLMRENLVRERRDALHEACLAQALERDSADQRRADAQATIDEITKTLAGKDLDRDRKLALEQDLKAATSERDQQLQAALTGSTFIDHATAVLERVDGFLSAIRAVTDGASRSQLVSALLREALHPTTDGSEPAAVPRVLFVRATSGSVSQLVDDRPFFFKDRFESIASVSIAYWMLDATTNRIVASGSCSGAARIAGTVGRSFQITDVT